MPPIFPDDQGHGPTGKGLKLGKNPSKNAFDHRAIALKTKL